jgi:acetylornithine deacetylase/succinyl-diaminopimelate desuccinylase-like protein
VQTFIRLKKEGWVPWRDLVQVFSGDEESGMVSTRAQAKYVAETIDPAFVLNSDAGGIALASDFSTPAMRMQAAEKTFVSFELTVRNQGGHSSRPRADNAIYELAAALTKISQYRFPKRSTRRSHRETMSPAAKMCECDTLRRSEPTATNPPSRTVRPGSVIQSGGRLPVAAMTASHASIVPSGVDRRTIRDPTVLSNRLRIICPFLLT